MNGSWKATSAPRCPEFVEDANAGRLPHVPDVGLVRHAEHQDAAVAHRPPGVVQDLRHAGGDVGRHPLVHVLRGLEHPEALAGPPPHLPGQVRGVQRDAVPADPGAGVERHEAERLRRRGVDHLPHVDPQLVGELGELVDQRDVHVAERVLQQLRGLRDAGGRDGQHLVDEGPVERRGRRRGLRRVAAHQPWGGAHPVLAVPGIDALGRVGQQEVVSRSAARRTRGSGARPSRWSPGTSWTPGSRACPGAGTRRRRARPARRTGGRASRPAAGSARRSRRSARPPTAETSVVKRRRPVSIACVTVAGSTPGTASGRSPSARTRSASTSIPVTV